MDSRKIELIRSAQAGDTSSLNALIEIDLEFIHYSIRKALHFIKHVNSREYLGAGCMGYRRAVLYFNPDLSFKLSTLAYYCISREVRRVFFKEQHLISVPREGTPWSNDNQRQRSAMISIGRITPDCEKFVVPADDGSELAEMRKLYEEAIPSLKKKEIDVLDMRMSGMNLESIGAILNVSKERVRQIELIAINKIRSKNDMPPLRRRGMRSRNR